MVIRRKSKQKRNRSSKRRTSRSKRVSKRTSRRKKTSRRKSKKKTSRKRKSLRKKTSIKQEGGALALAAGLGTVTGTAVALSLGPAALGGWVLTLMGTAVATGLGPLHYVKKLNSMNANDRRQVNSVINTVGGEVMHMLAEDNITLHKPDQKIPFDNEISVLH